MSACLQWRYDRFDKFPLSAARTIDPEQTSENRCQVQDEVLHSPACCVGHTIRGIQGNITVDDVAPDGTWTEFWAQSFWSVFDALDCSTRALEALHAAQQKLLMGSSGGGAGFIDFAAKCVNRLSASLFGTGLMRNSSPVNALRGAKRPREIKHEPSRKELRGGTSSGKHVLHSEVCRKLRLASNNPAAHTSTAERWASIPEEKKGSYKLSANINRRLENTTPVACVSNAMPAESRSRSCLPSPTPVPHGRPVCLPPNVQGRCAVECV